MLAHFSSKGVVKSGVETKTRETRLSRSALGFPSGEGILAKLTTTHALSPHFAVGVLPRNRHPTPISECPHQSKPGNAMWLVNGRAGVQLSQATPSSCAAWKELGSPLCSWRGGVQILVEFDCGTYQRGCLWWRQDGAGAKGCKMNCQGPDLPRVTAKASSPQHQGWNLD